MGHDDVCGGRVGEAVEGAGTGPGGAREPEDGRHDFAEQVVALLWGGAILWGAYQLLPVFIAKLDEAFFPAALRDLRLPQALLGL